MPELPEVQTVVEDLIAAGIPGVIIGRAQVHWPRTLDGITPHDFRKQIRGKTITAIKRRAKFIILNLDPRLLLIIHLRMTGRIEIASGEEPLARHHHVILHLDDGRQLRFHDTRKFGRLYLTKTPDKILGQLGPEPLSSAFTAHMLGQRLQSRHRQLKPLLLDQTFLAGLGNIYVDEALWQARLHPLRNSASLEIREIRSLHRAIRKVLRQGLNNLGTTLGKSQINFYSVGSRRGRNQDALKVFRRHGLPCPRCRRTLIQLRVGQRGTHICPRCQPHP
jgi:formamidopyrimidine-DNA glycosylase